MWLKNGSVEPARPCYFPVSGRAFWEAFCGRSRGLARHDAQTQLKVRPSVWGSDLVVLVSGCQDVTSYTKATMLICDLAESEEALGWKLWFRHQK